MFSVTVSYSQIIYPHFFRKFEYIIDIYLSLIYIHEYIKFKFRPHPLSFSIGVTWNCTPPPPMMQETANLPLFPFKRLP